MGEEGGCLNLGLLVSRCNLRCHCATFGVKLRPLVSLWDWRGPLRIGWPLWTNVDNGGQGGVGLKRGGGSSGYPRLHFVTSGYLWLPVVTFAVKLEPSVGFEGGVSTWDFQCQCGTFGVRLGSSVVVEFDRWCVCLLSGWMFLTRFL